MNTNQDPKDQSPYQRSSFQVDSQSNNGNYRSNAPSSRRSSQLNKLSKGLPQRQEWSLIYKSAEQQQRMMQQMQKNYIKNKQREVKQALDRQVLEKHSYGGNEKVYDKQYKQWTLDRIKKEQDKEKMEAQQRRIKRKQMQDINFYNLSIKNKTKQMTPEKHLFVSKPQEQTPIASSRKRSQDFRQSRDSVNQSAIYSYDKQKKSYQNVYDIYSDLVKQQKSRVKEQQQKIMRDAQMIRQDGLKKQQQKRMNKQDDKRKVKQVLDHQVQIHNLQSENNKRSNPQQEISYKLFSNLNRQSVKKRIPLQHVEYLRKQMQEEKQRKSKSRYMSEQEYRLNMEQLNKAVNGKYVHDGYQDRSVNSIGQRLRKFARAGNEMSRIMGMNYQTPTNTDGKYDQDSQVVRRRIEQMNYQRKNSKEHVNQAAVWCPPFQNNIF